MARPMLCLNTNGCFILSLEIYFVLPTKRNSLNPNKVDSASNLMFIIVSIMKDEASLIQMEKARNSIHLPT